MDRRSTAQDVHRCDLCETAIAQSYCDLCHVNLCKPCIGEHISDEYDKHKIVRFQDRNSTLIYPKCTMHPQKNCELQCKNCDNFICSSCTASEQHRGHAFVEVTDIYIAKKEVIEEDTEKLQNIVIPQYEEIAHDLEGQIANLDEEYEKLITEISKQGEEWHKEIDIVINRVKTEISEIKINHREVLQRHLDENKQIQSLIDQTQLAIKEIKKSPEVSSNIEYNSKIKELYKLQPLKVKVLLPTFIPKPLDHEKLYLLFGQIAPLTTATEETDLSPNLPTNSIRELMDEPELVATLQTGYNNLLSITYIDEDRIWTSGQTNAIKCFSFKGSLLQKIQTKSGEWPSDIAVNSDEDLLYSEWFTRTVNKVKNGVTEESISLQGWKPANLCATSTGDLLVAMYSDTQTQSKVVRYSGSTEKQIIQLDDKGKPIFSGNNGMKCITENRNHDICVADWKAEVVVVVNQDGKLRWRYTGHPPVARTKSFKPCGITTDTQSRILTADYDNHCIHILDQNGLFLCFINNCDLEYPRGLCVDKDDNLFVCEYYKGNVRKIKYSK